MYCTIVTHFHRVVQCTPEDKYNYKYWGPVFHHSYSSLPHSLESEEKRETALIGQHLTITYTKLLANPIIFLTIGDKLGPLGNIRRAISVQTLCLRTSIYCHEHSACGVRIWDLSSRALCPPHTSTRFRIMHQVFTVHLWDLESSFRRTYHGNDIYAYHINEQYTPGNLTSLLYTLFLNVFLKREPCILPRFNSCILLRTCTLMYVAVSDWVTIEWCRTQSQKIHHSYTLCQHNLHCSRNRQRRIGAYFNRTLVQMAHS